MKRKIIKIDTIAVLKHRHCDLELHLKNDKFYMPPLNMFQVLMYKLLGFDYIYGENYVKLMTDRLILKKQNKGINYVR